MLVELQLRATLVNIESFMAEGEDFRWYIKVITEFALFEYFAMG